MSYGFRVEICGRYACFSRPELKVERVSYDVITPSAARGILEAVFWKPAIKYIIDQIDICAPIKFENIRRNEINNKIPNSSVENAESRLLSGSLYTVASQERAQRAAMVLKDVKYVITAHFQMTDKAGPDDNESKFTAILHRRLEKGQNYHTPYLGTREFPASVRIIKEGETQPEPITESRSLGLMLYDIDYVRNMPGDVQSTEIKYDPMYFMAEMKQGVIDLRNVEVLK